MEKHQRFKLVVLTSSLTFVALSVLLLLNAISLADFALPGQPFYHGASNQRVILAFIMLGTVTLSLLRIAIRNTSTPTCRNASTTISSRKERSASAGRVASEVRVEQAEGHREIEAAAPKKGDGQLLSETAGELRTSVEVIQEELEEILDEEVPADKEHMQSLYEETDRLRKIIVGMEQLSQAQAIARSLKRESLQVELLLNGIIEKTRAAVTDRDVAYSLECEAGLVMTGDPDCIGRIVENIADNAARAIKGSGTVTLSAARKGDLVVFSVKDTGTGIRRAHLSHLYERFFRGTGSGIGMGLSIVKELVDACGGKIDVQTEVNKGTTFTVQLPRE
jgi:signal transduction histidine kinase